MKAKYILAAGLLSVFAAACGGAPKGGETPGSAGSGKPAGPTTSTGEIVDSGAQARFSEAVEVMVAHDKANDWNESACSDVAKKFESAASAQKSGRFPEATFNAGLAAQRCGNDAEAKARFQKALTDDSKFHFARVQLALYSYKADGNLDGAIGAMQQAVLDAQFQNVPALVNLALFQMQRDGATPGNGCKDDMDCAKTNLQRALAIDDSYMPAFNQLALFYFQQAKKKAGAITKKGGRAIVTNAALAKRADVQQLELAALVCSQAIRKNRDYAPIHNTAGLIQNELGQVNGAVQEFKAAASLDPRFFEAQMNYAAVNLSFRGFDQAQGAYEKAIQMRPNDYDAHLGYALALRGQINDSNYDAQLARVQAELDTCKKLDGARPDAFYNEGILTQEYRAKSGGDKASTIKTYKAAQAIYRDFIVKAAGKTEYDGAVRRAQGDGEEFCKKNPKTCDRGRIGDMDDIIQFLEIPDQNTVAPPAAPPSTPANQGGAAPVPAAAAPAPEAQAPVQPARAAK
jgi:tetratricopeptide (TPR) repeat protein